MCTKHDDIISVKERHEESLLQIEGVHAVSIGYKVSNEIPSEQLAIVVHMERKVEETLLAPHQKIPPYIEGYPTDIVISPPFVSFIDETSTNPLGIDNTKYRPIPGGAEIFTPDNDGICTLGMFARSLKEGDSPSDIYLLTNAHCLLVENQAVYQPESRNTVDYVANATRTVNSEQVDGGIAKMVQASDAEPNYIVGIGVPTGVYDVSIENLEEQVIKRGRTTRTTIGYIAYVEVTIATSNKKHQIIIRSDEVFAAPGDSGSVVLFYDGENKHNVIGLLWGGVLEYTILSPIKAVREELEIELLTMPIQISYEL